MSYTDHPSQMPGIVFPNRGMQTLSSFIHLFGCSVLAFCFARRSKNLLLWETWAGMSWPRLCIKLVFADSWLFLFSTGVLINGAGMSSNFVSCVLGIYACIILYAFSKIMIYWFLIEKVHIVWGGTHQPRLRSKVYWLCLITMLPYVAIVIIMLIGRVAYFRPDRACIIGLRKYASLSLLIYDLYINIFLTGMFLWPLFRSRLANPKIRKMAMRTLVAAGAALTTSTINIAVLTIMHGQQLGWVCLGSCGADVTMNALVLFWVTDNAASSVENTPATGGLTGAAPTHGAAPAQPGVASHQSYVADEAGFKSPARFAAQYPDSMYDYMPNSPGIARSSTTHRARPGTADTVVFSKERKDKKKTRGSKSMSILSKIGEALKNRNEDGDRNHQMSVQVTITTEQQGDIMLNDVKYLPSASSINESVRTYGQNDVEKGLDAPRM
ncbi:hypothetical protein RhiJN_06491 [Ceratobasidium sp. AG-Ba]|nr:hypothetical protein RhiJN_06491 [Ceratobasidium sp. AG-Ba]QRW07408.1 hypothetical protein RhiLY_06407 [Ceratobasidium sp. AG-Ba]